MEIFIEYFDEIVYGFQISQVVVTDIDTNAKIQSSISSVNDLEIAELCNINDKSNAKNLIRTHLYKVGMFGISDGDHSMDFFYQFLLLVVIEVHIPFSQPSLSSPILDKDKSDLIK